LWLPHRKTVFNSAWLLTAVICILIEISQADYTSINNLVTSITTKGRYHMEYLTEIEYEYTICGRDKKLQNPTKQQIVSKAVDKKHVESVR
jgi:hypothetical protein